MRKTVIAILSVVMTLGGFAKDNKKAAEAVDVFPDGTPIGEWFQDETVAAPEELGKIYSLADFGLFSDPRTIVTEKIQAVIDKAAAEGGGVIYVPEGIYKTGALFFKQGTHLYLKQGAIILGSENIADFPIIMTRVEGEWCKYFAGLINAENLDGFSITGPGIIDGNGSTYWQAFRLRRQWNPACTNKDEQRPRLVYMNSCKNVTVADVTLQNSPFWSSHYYKCENLRIFNVRIFSPLRPIASASADGIDMDVCQNVHIKGCRLTVNDDAVCFKGGKGPDADKDEANGPNMNILVEDVFFDNTTGSCMTCGSESIHAFNILMRNCRVEGGGSLLQLKMRPDTPQVYEYITIDNVKGYCRQLTGIAPWRQFFNLKGHTEIPRSHANNIVFRNLDLKLNAFIGAAAAPDEYDLKDFRFENINVTADRAEWNPEAFYSYTMTNVVVNGQEIK